MNLSNLRHFLNTQGIYPKKRLSQNFLIDTQIIQKIIREAHVESGDYILEIGPGAGAITEALVNTGAEVIAVEKDPTLARSLSRFETVQVFEEDILKFPLEKLKRKAKVISNLPFQLTSPILARLVPRKDLFSSITVVLQEEVARRITAGPNTTDYGSLTVFINFYASVRYAFAVSRHCFYPKPEVDASVVTLKLHEKPSVDSEEEFFVFMRTAFQQRRKMVRNSLRKYYEPEKTAQVLKQIGKDENARPENLSLEAFLALYTYRE